MSYRAKDADATGPDPEIKPHTEGAYDRKNERPH